MTDASRALKARPNSSAAYMTVDAVARRWAIGPRFVRRLVDRGELASHRFGRAVRIPVRAVETYEAAHGPDADQ